jgi:serine protease Do
MGVISAVKRSFRVDEKVRVYQDMIQTDAAINPGNSGGPLINLDGQAIGINTFIFSRSGDSSSVGFSIPINRAHRIADEIIRYGKIRTLGLDFNVMSVTPYIAQRLGLSVKSGAIVRDVAQDGPAQRAGLRERDVIVRADDKEISDETDLLAYFLTRTVGERVKLRVLRDGAPIELLYQINEGRSV